jgi:hypothetical protein
VLNIANDLRNSFINLIGESPKLWFDASSLTQKAQTQFLCK